MPRSVEHRRFPPPWTIDEANDACFIVRDSTRQALAYFYFEEESGRRSAAEAAYQGRGAAAGGELREAAGVAAPKGRQPVECAVPAAGLSRDWGLWWLKARLRAEPHTTAA